MDARTGRPVVCPECGASSADPDVEFQIAEFGVATQFSSLIEVRPMGLVVEHTDVEVEIGGVTKAIRLYCRCGYSWASHRSIDEHRAPR
jgi:hypothetical protein